MITDHLTLAILEAQRIQDQAVGVSGSPTYYAMSDYIRRINAEQTAKLQMVMVLRVELTRIRPKLDKLIKRATTPANKQRIMNDAYELLDRIELIESMLAVLDE